MLRAQDGLPEDRIGSMTEDVFGTLWLATSGGGASVRLNEDGRWNIRRFSTFYGLPANQVTAVLYVNEQIWFGTTKGIAMITPRKLTGLQPAPPPFFESLTINQNALPKSVFNSGLHLTCKHDENNLQLEFINLNFPTGAQTQYRYRIDRSNPGNLPKTRNPAFFAPTRQLSNRRLRSRCAGDLECAGQPAHYDSAAILANMVVSVVDHLMYRRPAVAFLPLPTTGTSKRNGSARTNH